MARRDVEERSIDERLAEVRNELQAAKSAGSTAEAEIKKLENQLQTATAIGDRDIKNLERQAEDAQQLDRYEDVRLHQEEATERRNELAGRINQLEARLGDLRSQRIEANARQGTLEAELSDLREQGDEEASRGAISEEQVKRAAELEKRLERLEGERADLIARVEQYAPLVEAQREAATGSGSVELSKAYAEQAREYRTEWQRWLKWLGVSVAVALVVGVLVFSRSIA